MRKGKFVIALFSAVILLAILVMAVHRIPEPGVEYPVAIRAGAETLTVWTEDGENYYGFLPGHISVEDVMLLPMQEGAEVAGQALPLSCETLSLDQPCSLRWEEGGQEHQGTLRLLSSGGVATLYLSTQSGSMDFIHAEKGNAERGTLQLYDEKGQLNYSGDLKTIRGRGNSTWVVHEKKPYSLKLMDKADLLGMGAAKDWILMADALDSSAMRNKIVYDFAARIGLEYTPECRWTEVYLNGEYAGLYLLTERVEVHSERVDLSPDGSLVCMDRDIRVEEDTDPYFVTDSGQYLQIRESSDIGSLKALFQAMENAVLAEDGVDQRTGRSWQELIDLESWVKKYLIEEIFDSYDANFQSQYFYCYETEPDSRIYAGPIWDYDASLGNPAVWALNSPRGLFAWRPEAMTGYATPWLYSLYGKEAFRQMLEEKYQEICLPQLEKLLQETLEEYSRQIAPAFQRNRLRWKVETEGLEKETAYISSYLRERITFLSQLWLEDREFRIVRLQETASGGYYGYYAVEPGSCFTELPEKEGEDFLGWYREDTQEPFDPAEPIWEDLHLIPRYASDEEAGDSDPDKGLMDLVLDVYVYVPAAVLAVLGVGAAAVSIHRSIQKPKKEKQGSKIP